MFWSRKWHVFPKPSFEFDLTELRCSSFSSFQQMLNILRISIPVEINIVSLSSTSTRLSLSFINAIVSSTLTNLGPIKQRLMFLLFESINELFQIMLIKRRSFTTFGYVLILLRSFHWEISLAEDIHKRNILSCKYIIFSIVQNCLRFYQKNYIVYCFRLWSLP